jgi:hypothetical protein
MMRRSKVWKTGHDGEHIMDDDEGEGNDGKHIIRLKDGPIFSEGES